MAIKRKFPPRVATVYCSGGCRAKKDEDGARTVCDVSCIACGLCVKNCPADAIHIEQFHAVIDACLLYTSLAFCNKIYSMVINLGSINAHSIRG